MKIWRISQLILVQKKSAMAKRRAKPHTWFRRGTKVFVILTDGQKFRDKFVDKKNTAVILLGRGKVPIADIRSMTIFRSKTHER